MHHLDLVPCLSDGRVVLDGHRAEDVDAHVAGEDDETARRFGWWPQRSTHETVMQAYDEWARDWVVGGNRRTFAVRDASDLRLVGGCELRIQPDGVTAHVSYWTNVSERGRGCSSRALTLLVEFASTLGIRRLEAHVAPDNVASRRVSQSAGFVEQDLFRDETGTELVRYVLTVA